MVWFDLVSVVAGLILVSLIAFEISRKSKYEGLSLFLLSVLLIVVVVWVFFRVMRLYYDLGGWFAC